MSLATKFSHSLSFLQPYLLPVTVRLGEANCNSWCGNIWVKIWSWEYKIDSEKRGFTQKSAQLIGAVGSSQHVHKCREVEVFPQSSLFDLGMWDPVTTVRKIYLRNFETDIRICCLKQYSLKFAEIVKIPVSSNGIYFPFKCMGWFLMCSCVQLSLLNSVHVDPPLKGQGLVFKAKDFDSRIKF